MTHQLKDNEQEIKQLTVSWNEISVNYRPSQ
jgi:hypothetical protein